MAGTVVVVDTDSVVAVDTAQTSARTMAGYAATPTATSASVSTTQAPSGTSPSADPAGGATSAPTTVASSSAASIGGGSTKRFMGSSTVLIGGGMSDASAAAAPFDLRYAYLVSRPAPSSKYYSAKRCEAAWADWWGCWGGTPGSYVTRTDAQVAKATYKGKRRPQKMVWTWFMLHTLGDMAGKGDTLGAVGALNRADLLTLYMNDYRFFLRKVGKSHDAIDLEPDFWGFARSQGNLNKIPAKVSSANPRDCGSQKDTVAGLARCLILMARKYAPNAAMGLHLTCWDWPGNMQKCVKDYVKLGAKKADFLVADISDRDAGWYAQPAHGGSNSFWTAKKAAANLKWYKTMAEGTGKPVVLWQIPLGNKAQNNTFHHYKDDKVDWLFAHMKQVAAAHVAALLFGPG
ncbi:MAG TPA: hypothetical protein VLL08_08825, partial [Kineosporiaceae bacterium]|nr:hypothetical protein [Kineosporiaceae bacterium]